MIQELKVVKDPKKLNPRNNLILLLIDNLFKNPNRKQPVILTKKILLISHLTNEPIMAPIEIIKKLF